MAPEPFDSRLQLQHEAFQSPTRESSERLRNDSFDVRSVSGHRASLKREIEPANYSVKPGDSLTKIARNHLGKGAGQQEISEYVKQIGQLNKIRNLNLIHVGQKLELPGRTKDGAVARIDAQGNKSTRRHDGATVTEFPNKTQRIDYANGTRVTKTADGATITEVKNGPLTIESRNPRKMAEYQLRFGIRVESPNAIKVTRNRAGITITETADGDTIHRYPFGLKVTQTKAGSEISESMDGTKCTREKDSTLTVENKDPHKLKPYLLRYGVSLNGQDVTKVSKKPDGSLIAETADGSRISRQGDGTQIIENKQVGLTIENKDPHKLKPHLRKYGIALDEENVTRVTRMTGGRLIAETADGKRIIREEEGTKITETKDAKITQIKDGPTITLHNNGMREATYPDGRKFVEAKDARVSEAKNGPRVTELKRNGAKITEQPSGTTTIEYRDGVRVVVDRQGAGQLTSQDGYILNADKDGKASVVRYPGFLPNRARVEVLKKRFNPYLS